MSGERYTSVVTSGGGAEVRFSQHALHHVVTQYAIRTRKPEKHEADQRRVFEPTELGTAAVQQAYLEAELMRERRINAELRALLETSESDTTGSTEIDTVDVDAEIVSEEVDRPTEKAKSNSLVTNEPKEKEMVINEVELSPAEARYESIVLYILEAGGEVTGEDANMIKQRLNLKESDWGNARLRLRRQKVLELEKLDNGRGYSRIAVNLKVLQSLEGEKDFVSRRVIAKLDEIEAGEKDTEDTEQEERTAEPTELVENKQVVILHDEGEKESEGREQGLVIEEVEQAFEDYKIPDPSLTKKLEAAERIVLFLLARSNGYYMSENDNAGGEMRGRIGEVHELLKNDWTNAMTMLREYKVILTEKAGLRRTRSYQLDLEALQQVLDAPFITDRVKARMSENDEQQPAIEKESLGEMILSKTETVDSDSGDEIEPPEDVQEEPAAEEVEDTTEPEEELDVKPLLDEPSMNGDDPLDEILGGFTVKLDNVPPSRNRAPRKQDPRLVLKNKVHDQVTIHNQSDIKFDSVRDIAVAIADSIDATVVEALEVMKDMMDPKEPVAQLYSYNVGGTTKYKLKLLPPKGKEPKLLV